MDKYKMSLEVMCARCINYEVCGGTGCQPKKELKELIELVEKGEWQNEQKERDGNCKTAL